MGRILRRRESAQEDSENILARRLKQKTSQLKGLTKENKSPSLGKKITTAKTTKRMALVDKTNKSSPPRDLITAKDVPSKLVGRLDPKPFAVSGSAKVIETPIGSAKSDALVTSPDVKENCIQKYRASPVEKLVTQCGISLPSESKGKTSKAKVTKKKNGVKAKIDNDGKFFKLTDEPEAHVSEIPLKALVTPEDVTVKVVDSVNPALATNSDLREVVETPVKEADAPETSLDLKQSCDPKYRVFPIERPTTRSRTSVPTVKGKSSKGKVVKKKNDVKANIDDGKNFKSTADPEVQVPVIPPQGQMIAEDVPLKSADSINPKPVISSSTEVDMPVKKAKPGTHVTSPSLKENRVPRYRASPVERPATRGWVFVRTEDKGKTSKGKDIKQKSVKAKIVEDDKRINSTPSPEALNSPRTQPTSSCPLKFSVLVEKIGLDNVPQGGDRSTESVHTSKAGNKDVNIGVSSVRKRKHADVRNEEEVEAVGEREIRTKSGPNEGLKIDLCAYCRGVEGTCSCHKLAETPLSSSKTSRFSKESSSHVAEKKNYLPEPTPSCSKISAVEAPFRKPSTPKFSPASKKVSSPSIFSCFKKPDTPRRNSTENKIFVSSSKQTPSTNLRNTKNPVYANKNMTPLRQRSSLVLEQKEELYEFEVDESEPKPKKKQRRIMKIQRVRAHKKTKPKAYVPDPEMELRLLRNLDLSPSIMDHMRAKKTEKVELPPACNQPSTSSHGAEMAVSGDPKPQTESSVEDRKAPSSDGGIYDVYDDDHHDDYDVDHHDDYGACASSPCSKYGSSTPLQNALHKSRDSLLDESIRRFGGLSVKLYSPVKSKPSPIPVLLESYNNDQVRNSDSDQKSITSNVTVFSENSMYQHDLDISASTPVKFHKHDSTRLVSKALQPTELNLSNCFGFDEPEIMEEPLVSPIKTTVYVPPPAAPPARAARIVKKKLLVAPPAQAAEVDVEKVINQLRSEVGENSAASTSLANLSVYEDTEISLKKRSPMKHYLQQRPHATPEKIDGDSFSDTEATAVKIPRLSYQRLKLRKRVVIGEQSVLEKSTHSEASDRESSDSDREEEEPAEIPFEIPAHKVVRKHNSSPRKKEAPKKKEKGMTKKEEEELEKWAKMFNSQCDQVDGFGLCVE